MATSSGTQNGALKYNFSVEYELVTFFIYSFQFVSFYSSYFMMEILKEIKS